MSEIIKLKKYEAKVVNGRIQYTAVDLKGKSYPMPDAFATMYDDRHLAITKTTSERPEMFDIDSDEYYIPLRC